MNRITRMSPFLLPLCFAMAVADVSKIPEYTPSQQLIRSPNIPVLSDSPKNLSTNKANYADIVGQIDSLHALFSKAGEGVSAKVCSERISIDKEAALEFMYLGLMEAVKNSVDEGKLTEVERSAILMANGYKLKEIGKISADIRDDCQKNYHSVGQKKLILT